MKRRAFLKKSVLTAISMTTFGKICQAETGFVGNTPTTSDVLGPFYRPGAPVRGSLIPPGDTGEVMNVTGTIFGNDGRTPLANVLLECWQCDQKGNYDNK